MQFYILRFKHLFEYCKYAVTISHLFIYGFFKMIYQLFYSVSHGLQILKKSYLLANAIFFNTKTRLIGKPKNVFLDANEYAHSKTCSSVIA